MRVSQLASEYGVKSAEVITMLTDMGEYVKAASSSVEPPVVKRFEDRYGAELRAKQEAIAAKKAAPAKKRYSPTATCTSPRCKCNRARS